MPLLLVLVAFLAVPTVAQAVRAEAPWLTVYDEAGRTKWEVRMEVLVRTAAGWEGRGVFVQLYYEGVPSLALRAPRIRADRYGREWSLFGDGETEGPVGGDGEGFSFTCREARWAGGLVLVGLAAEGRGVTLRAAEARWRLGEVVDLVEATVVFAGWTVGFAAGRYRLADDELAAGAVTATGHGVTLVGTALTAWPKEGRLHLREARLVRAP